MDSSHGNDMAAALSSLAEGESVELTLPSETIDLAYLRDLLVVLSDHHVQAFAGGGISIAFKDEPGLPQTLVQAAAEEDTHSTSPRKVQGYQASPGGFAHPSLWASQNGKRLTFDGSLK